jgi:hypothetical protein
MNFLYATEGGKAHDAHLVRQGLHLSWLPRAFSFFIRRLLPSVNEILFVFSYFS